MSFPLVDFHPKAEALMALLASRSHDWLFWQIEEIRETSEITLQLVMALGDENIVVRSSLPLEKPLESPSDTKSVDTESGYQELSPSRWLFEILAHPKAHKFEPLSPLTKDEYLKKQKHWSDCAQNSAPQDPSNLRRLLKNSLGFFEFLE